MKEVDRNEDKKMREELLAKLPDLADGNYIETMSAYDVADTLDVLKAQEDDHDITLSDLDYVAERDSFFDPVLNTPRLNGASFVQLAMTLRLAKELDGRGRDIFEQVAEGRQIFEGLRGDVAEGRRSVPIAEPIEHVDFSKGLRRDIGL